MAFPPASALVIEPNGVYDDAALVLGLGLTHATLVRARREGQLRFTRKGQRIFYLGRWILNWLAETKQPRMEGADAR